VNNRELNRYRFAVFKHFSVRIQKYLFLCNILRCLRISGSKNRKRSEKLSNRRFNLILVEYYELISSNLIQNLIHHLYFALSPDCDDKTNDCNFYISFFGCDDSLTDLCPRSCNKCTTEPEPVKPIVGDCNDMVDQLFDCEVNAFFGDCDHPNRRIRSKMESKCPRSCCEERKWLQWY